MSDAIHAKVRAIETLSAMPVMEIAHNLAMTNMTRLAELNGGTFTPIPLAEWVESKVNDVYHAPEDNYANVNRDVAERVYSDLILLKDVINQTTQAEYSNL